MLSPDSSADSRRTPPGFTAIGAFLLFGTFMAGLAALTLSFRGTPLNRIWALNPTAYARLAPVAPIAGPLFFLLSIALACAAAGWFRRRLWGWMLTVIIIASQVLGDLVNCLRGDFLRGALGLVIAGALLIFLLRPAVRAGFRRTYV